MIFGRILRNIFVKIIWRIPERIFIGSILVRILGRIPGRILGRILVRILGKLLARILATYRIFFL
jgi:hypothetical protein